MDLTYITAPYEDRAPSYNDLFTISLGRNLAIGELREPLSKINIEFAKEGFSKIAQHAFNTGLSHGVAREKKVSEISILSDEEAVDILEGKLDPTIVVHQNIGKIIRDVSDYNEDEYKNLESIIRGLTPEEFTKKYNERKAIEDKKKYEGFYDLFSDGTFEYESDVEDSAYIGVFSDSLLRTPGTTPISGEKKKIIKDEDEEFRESDILPKFMTPKTPKTPKTETKEIIKDIVKKETKEVEVSKGFEGKFKLKYILNKVEPLTIPSDTKSKKYEYTNEINNIINAKLKDVGEYNYELKYSKVSGIVDVKTQIKDVMRSFGDPFIPRVTPSDLYSFITGKYTEYELPVIINRGVGRGNVSVNVGKLIIEKI